MITYTRRWTIVAIVIVTVFAVVAVLRQPLTAAVVFVVVALASGVFSAAAGSWPLRRCLRIGLLTGSGLLAVIGATAFLGGWVVPLGALLAVTSPPLMRRIVARGTAAGIARNLRWTGPVDYGLPEATETMSTAELCKAWADSRTALEGTTTTAGRARIALLRQGYLDELERRDASGFRAWLHDRSATITDPALFLRRDDQDAA